MYILPVKPYDYDRKLSKYFKLGEFIQSRTAVQQKITNQFVHRDHVVENIIFLHDRLLLPLREAIDSPITITSGYRCSALNAAVSGATNSLHLQGLAVDVYAGNRQAMLIETAHLFDFHELIIHKSYVHLSIKRCWNERKVRDLR